MKTARIARISLRWPALPGLALPPFLRFSRAEWIFSLKAFAASMLAMYVASRAGLPRPFWAMMTAYVVASPLAGAVRSKALFRFCGTLLGCTATVLIVPALSNAPELLSLALCLWVGACLFLSLLDRTPRSYVFMLAGYTAALIGFPSVEAPTLLFDTAMLRVEEIGLGILCGSLVHSIVLPVGLAPSLLAVLDRALGDARRWLGDLLVPAAGEGESAQALAVDRRRLAIDITQLRLLSTHVPFDTSHLRWTAGAIREMQDRIAALTPALSAVEDRLQALQQAEGVLAPDVLEALRATAAWLRDDAPAAGMPALRRTLRAFGAARRSNTDADAQPFAPWPRALRLDLAARLEELVAGWSTCRALRADIDAGLAGNAVPLRRRAALGHRVLHRDVGMALLSAVAAVLAVGLCCTFWIATGWTSGSAAAMMAAVFCSFFATLDDPVPAIHGFMVATLWSVPISAVYVLAVMPLIHDFGMLVLSCAPVFLVLGCYAGRPATTLPAMAMLFGVAGALAMHDTSTVDLPTYINSMLAQVLGIVVAARVTRLVRSVGADWSAARIRRATWADLAGMASAPQSEVRRETYATGYAGRMLDRISLLAPRVAEADTGPESELAQRALRDLRIGPDIAALQQLRWRLPKESRDDLAALLDGIARVFRERARGLEAARSPALLARLDTLLAAALRAVAHDDAAHARQAAAALVGLRRNLFHDAPAPGAVSPPPTESLP